METFATEILLKIFDLLEIEDLLNTSKVCKRFQAIIEDYIKTITITVVHTVKFHKTYQKVYYNRQYRWNGQSFGWNLWQVKRPCDPKKITGKFKNINEDLNNTGYENIKKKIHEKLGLTT